MKFSDRRVVLDEGIIVTFKLSEVSPTLFEGRIKRDNGSVWATVTCNKKEGKFCKRQVFTIERRNIIEVKGR